MVVGAHHHVGVGGGVEGLPDGTHLGLWSPCSPELKRRWWK